MIRIIIPGLINHAWGRFQGTNIPPGLILSLGRCGQAPNGKLVVFQPLPFHLSVAFSTIRCFRITQSDTVWMDMAGRRTNQ